MTTAPAVAPKAAKTERATTAYRVLKFPEGVYTINGPPSVPPSTNTGQAPTSPSRTNRGSRRR
jgi:hypothetical protein